METITLFTPGPTHIPKQVLAGMDRPSEHHRTAEFRAVFSETASHLQQVINSPSAPLFLACSGTGAMEAVITCGLSEQDVLGYLDAGKFGGRWGAIATAQRRKHHALTVPWGSSPTIEEVRAFLTEHPDITCFALQYCETSTTILHDVPGIARMIRAEFPSVAIFVDAISAATAVPISFTELDIDALVLASQKSLMLPPGLTMVALSERYWERAEKANPTSLYFDLRKERASQAKGDGAWTPALTLIFGLRESLTLFENEGWQAVYDRHAACSALSQERFNKLGMPLVTSSHASPSVTGAFAADGMDLEELRKDLFTKFEIRIAGGQNEWKGKVLRVGHMGITAPENIAWCFDRIEEVLS